MPITCILVPLTNLVGHVGFDGEKELCLNLAFPSRFIYPGVSPLILFFCSSPRQSLSLEFLLFSHSLQVTHSLTHSPTIVQYAFRLHCHWSSCSSSQRLDLPRLRMLFLRACWIMTDFLRNLTIATATCSTLDSMKTRPQLSALRSWLLPSRMPQLSQQTSTTVM